ncbi:MAG: PorV/PorQ family protein [Elusimicrobia bacterium]|nr:PorV/PorQ family protein [Elusimicrobiota bacterium]
MRALVACAALCLAASGALAGVGRSGGLLLQQPFGARAFSLGGAYASIGEDAFALSYNPASLSRMNDTLIATEFIQSFEDVRLGYLAAASPLSPTQALGLSLAYLDGGKADIFDANGARSNSLDVQKDFVLQLGYARSLSLATGRLHLGGAAKVLRSRVAEQARATAFAGDLGAIYALGVGRGELTLGAAASNLGGSLRYSGGIATGSESDPLPLTARAAVGYGRSVLGADRITGSLGVDRLIPDETLSQSLGLEYNYRGLCSLRLGYSVAGESRGPRMGLGLSFKNVSVDYALGFIEAFSNIHQLSLSYGFNIPGIRYGATTPATPIETMMARAQSKLHSKRFFQAAAESDRIEAVFGAGSETTLLRHTIRARIDALLAPGGPAPERAYALAFMRYHNKEWSEAVAALEDYLVLRPDDEEATDYLSRAKGHLREEQKQLKMQQLARTGTLFELANQAYESGDLAWASRIIDEILRLGPYQPADSLRSQIEARRKAPPPGAAAQPKPRRVLPAQKAQAETLYYQAVRSYADNDLQDALDKLERGLELDPENGNIRNTLERIGRELREKGSKRSNGAAGGRY